MPSVGSTSGTGAQPNSPQASGANGSASIVIASTMPRPLPLVTLTDASAYGEEATDGRAVDRESPAGRRAQRHRAGVVARQPARDEGDHRRRLPRAGERVRGLGGRPGRPALAPDARVLLRHL